MKLADWRGSRKIIGMLHLAGNKGEKVERAVGEAAMLATAGVDAVLLSNHHGSEADVRETLEVLKTENYGLEIGVNILVPQEQNESLLRSAKIAREFELDFIHVSAAAGEYRECAPIEAETFYAIRNIDPDLPIMGGVWPKYFTPLSRKRGELQRVLEEAAERVDAVVVSGEETGKPTPLRKIKRFRAILPDEIPVIVGAGVDKNNAARQLTYADGAIIGSAFKAKYKPWKPSLRRVPRKPNTEYIMKPEYIERVMESVREADYI